LFKFLLGIGVIAKMKFEMSICDFESY